jgi:hypothetical protein
VIAVADIVDEDAERHDVRELLDFIPVAGWAVKGGIAYGATDDIGLKAIENPVHFRDLHTTILHQLGLNQDQLSFLHQGRKERLTEVRGEVIQGLI